MELYERMMWIESMEYENLKLEIRTHPDWYYAGCVETFLLLSGSLEIKVVRKYSSSIQIVRNLQSQITLTTKICGIDLDDKGITIM